MLKDDPRDFVSRASRVKPLRWMLFITLFTVLLATGQAGALSLMGPLVPIQGANGLGGGSCDGIEMDGVVICEPPPVQCEGAIPMPAVPRIPGYPPPPPTTPPDTPPTRETTPTDNPRGPSVPAPSITPTDLVPNGKGAFVSPSAGGSPRPPTSAPSRNGSVVVPNQELRLSVTHGVLPGTSPELRLPIGETYSSVVQYSGVNQSVGANWFHSLTPRIHVLANGDVRVVTWNAELDDIATRFVWNAGTQTYTAPPASRLKLYAAAPSGWLLRFPDGATEAYDANGLRTARYDRHNAGVFFTYNGQGQLLSILDSVGSSATVSWSAAGFISSIALSSGITVTYTQDVNQDLTQVSRLPASGYEQPNGTWSRSYSYATGTNSLDLDHNLVTVLDSTSSTLLGITYDAADRVVQEVGAGGATWLFTRLQGSNSVRVTSPTNQVREYFLDSNLQVVEVRDYTSSGMGGPPLRAGEPAYYAATFEHDCRPLRIVCA